MVWVGVWYGGLVWCVVWCGGVWTRRATSKNKHWVSLNDINTGLQQANNVVMFSLNLRSLEQRFE